MRQKTSFTSSLATLIGKPWLRYFAIVCIICFITSPSLAMASDHAIFVVLLFIDARFTRLLNSMNDRSIMHLYGFDLWGIIATGEIFNFGVILSLISPHFTMRAYLCVILSAASWLSWRTDFLSRADRCGPCWIISSICSREKYPTQSTGQLSRTYPFSNGIVSWY